MSATGWENERAGIMTGAAIEDGRGGRGRARRTRKGEADEDGRGGRGWRGKRVAQQAADEYSRPTAAVAGRNTGAAAIAAASSIIPGPRLHQRRRNSIVIAKLKNHEKNQIKPLIS